MKMLNQLDLRLQALALGMVIMSGLGMGSALANAPATGGSGMPAGAHAWGGPGGDGCRGGGDTAACQARRAEFAKKLGLTPEQQSKLKANREQFKQQNAATFERLKAQRTELSQLGDDPANQAKKEQLRAQLRQEMKALHAQREASLQAVLTPDQLKRWESMKQEMRAKHGGPGSGGMRRHPGGGRGGTAPTTSPDANLGPSS